VTTILEDQTIKDRDDRGSGSTYEDLSFRRCVFESCSLGIAVRPPKRPTVRRVSLTDCVALGCAIGSAIVEDVVIDGLATTGRVPFFVRGAAFRHVILRGHIGGVTITGDARRPSVNGWDDEALRNEIDMANAQFYQGVDWAIDISAAECEDLEIRGGIPARLIRRDPATQIVITRERALEGRWRELDLSGTWWPTTIDMLVNPKFLDSGYPEKILVAPKRHPNFPRLLTGLARLRDAGIAEPD